MLRAQAHLAQEIVAVGERERRRVGHAMRGHDRHDVFLGLGLAARRRARPGAARRGAAALAAGVAVDLVVVADVQDILVALGRGGERRQADVVGAAVAGPADRRLGLSVLPSHAGDAGRHGGGAGEGGFDGRHAVGAGGEGPGRDGGAAGRHDQRRCRRAERLVEPLQAHRHPAAGAVRAVRAQEARTGSGAGLGKRGRHGQPTSRGKKMGACGRSRPARSSRTSSMSGGSTSPPPSPTM